MQKKSTQRIKQSGEVFTPSILVDELLNKLPDDIWKDPAGTFLDPACGDGEFLVHLMQRLQQHHTDAHILDNMIHGVDLMRDNVEQAITRLYGEGNIQIISPATIPLYGKRPGIKNMFTYNGIVVKHIIQADGVIYDYSFDDYSHVDSDINIAW